MLGTTFKRLNLDWNAEPNDPNERVSVSGDTVELSFYLNPWAYHAIEGERAALTFRNAKKWRLGPTNDEGWFLGQCRYSDAAPEWGEFYEVGGDDPLLNQPEDWHEVGICRLARRHFLFYLRDNTFECVAADWTLHR